ncbi:MAG: hypothetical protein Q9180_009578, partial [Flavoplaca navasiana]
ARRLLNGILKSGTLSKTLSMIANESDDASLPIFLDVQGECVPESNGTAVLNKYNVSVVVDLILDVLRNVDSFTVIDIGVVTPYSAQVREMKQALRAASNDHDDFDEHWLGHERKIMYFDLVRADNGQGRLGFATKFTRPNVEASRHHSRLFFIGEPKCVEVLRPKDAQRAQDVAAQDNKHVIKIFEWFKKHVRVASVSEVSEKYVKLAGADDNSIEALSWVDEDATAGNKNQGSWNDNTGTLYEGTAQGSWFDNADATGPPDANTLVIDTISALQHGVPRLPRSTRGLLGN